MSELTTKTNRRVAYRQFLLTGTALGLFASAFLAGEADASDGDVDHPTVWIELGGQLEHMDGQGQPFAPAFIAQNAGSPVLKPVTPIQAQNPSPFGFSEDGKLAFQPQDSDWLFSIAVNYGRSSNFKRVDHQTNRVLHAVDPLNTMITILTTAEQFAETQVKRRESHAIVDFAAGKDVGLGLFGRGSSSVLGFGVRFAQFTSKENFDIRARPDLNLKYVPSATATARLALVHYNTYHATGQATRNFHGIGPTVSWTGMSPFLGDPQGGEVTFDWGINASVLFGKQKAQVGHQESAHYHSPVNKYNSTLYQHPIAGHRTDRSVIVPNAGGLAGVSWRVQNFKASVGYRADFFFNAMDTGIDTPKSQTVAFYGPFASISIGLGG